MRVAVIGAGAAGLVTARELLREGLDPVLFEQQMQPGGTWIYDPRVDSDPLGRAPDRTRVHGSLYASLRTNLPRDLMAFGDFPFEDRGDPRRFPGHAEVLRYLEAFVEAFDLTPRIRHGATVTRVHPLEHDQPWHAGDARPPSGWSVEWTDARGSQQARFDAIAVCNGHYREPRVPALPGLDAFEGTRLHSHSYRQPQAFAGRTVALLGAKSSGIDLSHELATVARRVILCARDLQRTDAAGARGNLDLRPSIVGLERDAIRLSDGTREDGVDALVLCTGYRYAFEFLDPAAGLLDGLPDRVFPLHLDLIAARAASLAFVGLPFSVVPFPLFEHQARLWARGLSGRVAIPPTSVRLEEAHRREERFEAAGVAPRHRLRYGDVQFRYGADLARLAGDDPPPAWREPLYAVVGKARRRDPIGYRDLEFPVATDLAS